MGAFFSIQCEFNNLNLVDVALLQVVYVAISILEIIFLYAYLILLKI